MDEFNKLGVFYLGRQTEDINGRPVDGRLLYDSKDLTTHAMVVGMTGSGKTGLCIDLLEEAAYDRIPSIIIDPKGDISNLLLTFPDLNAASFKPWVDGGQATRAGLTKDQFAKQQADLWRDGLSQWDITPENISKLRETVDFKVYTPGSIAGNPMAILKSFAAPGKEVLEDADTFNSLIIATVSSLLALVGIEADPIQSRQHILLSNIVNHHWRNGKSLTVARLIREIQNPPFETVGVLELETFFPKKDRSTLAMTLNNLLASPTFASWMTGSSLNIKRLLHTSAGKPKVSIISIAHLNDSQRMFFVTMLLNEMITWMRSQAGTSSLRAILYMDEVFGYFPPVGNPPSKEPMLTLLKQARAYGLGVVLATQNPVDIDYKGLSNMGTWFLGRLQTERDKARVLEGLEGAAAQAGSTFDKQKMEQILAGLGNRKFLMNNVHEDQPVVFQTRWAMSYLRGPLTRSQLQKLIDQDKSENPEEYLEAESEAESQDVSPKVELPEEDPRDLIPEKVDQSYLCSDISSSENYPIRYRPALFAEAKVHFVRATYKVDQWQDFQVLIPIEGDDIPDTLCAPGYFLHGQPELEDTPEEECQFWPIPKSLQKETSFRRWEKDLKNELYQKKRLNVWKCVDLKVYSKPGKSEGDFRAELETIVSEKRDLECEKLRKRYASKFQTMKNRVSRAEEKLEREEEQYKQSRTSSWLSMGTTIMGALLGRKAISSTSARSAAGSVRSWGRTSKEKSDIKRAADNLEDLKEQFTQLEEEFQNDLDGIELRLNVDELELIELEVSPRKSDTSIETLQVVWMPYQKRDGGRTVATFQLPEEE